MMCFLILIGSVESMLTGLGFPTVNGGEAILEDFLDLYGSVSAELEDNNRFEAVLRAGWSFRL